MIKNFCSISHLKFIAVILNVYTYYFLLIMDT